MLPGLGIVVNDRTHTSGLVLLAPFDQQADSLVEVQPSNILPPLRTPACPVEGATCRATLVAYGLVLYHTVRLCGNNGKMFAPTERIYSLRCEATDFYCAVHPLLGVAATDERATAAPELQPYLRDVHDHLLLVNEEVAAQRDLLGR